MQQTRTRILKSFFEAEPHGRRITVEELRELSMEDRNELARLAARELGAELSVAA